MFSDLSNLIDLLNSFSPKPLQRPPDPYVTGNPVGGGPAFVGRTDILREVSNYLSSTQQNAIVLYGQRRIGKTSILKQLEAQLLGQGHYQTIYFEMAGKTKEQQFSIETILVELAKSICQKLDLTKPYNGSDVEFHTWLAKLVDSDVLSDKSLVLLLDEFDSIDTPQTEQVRDTFFNYLREKLLPIELQKLNFIFAIGRNIGDFQSALFLFRTMSSYRVSLLTEKETENVVRLSETNSSLRWSKAAIGKVWEQTQGHAYLTQLLCSLIWSHCWDKEPTRIPTVSRKGVTEFIDKNIEQLFQRGIGALEWLWDGLPPACKIDTAALAELGDQVTSHEQLIAHLRNSGAATVIEELENAPRYLLDWDIIERDGPNGYRFRVELFRQWVRQHKKLTSVLRDELKKISAETLEHYQQAQSACEEVRIDDAVKILKSLIRINPLIIDAHRLLATILVEKNSLAEAQSVLENFYHCCPNTASPLLTNVLWLRAESCSRNNEKLVWCEKILEYDPNNLAAKQKRGEILLWQAKRFEEDEEYDKAAEAFLKVGLTEGGRRVWWKQFWQNYGNIIRGTIGFAIGFTLSFVFSYFQPMIELPWWGLGLGLGIIVAALFMVISFKKSTRKRL